MLDEIKKNSREKMQKAADALGEKFKTLRTGRASAALFDKIHVNSYGASTPLNQVASISTPEARLVVIQPWDKTLLGEIEKALQSSDLGINPSNDGNLIRITFPALTEERRKEILKNAKAMAEESRVALRNVRRDQNDLVKKAQKDSAITEDDQKKILDEIQKMTDDFIKQIDSVLGAKEKEILAE
jgi:ribosome recycling factor